MRILMFSTSYPPDLGGMEFHVYYLARALANIGNEVTVLGGHRSPAGRPHNPLIPYGSGLSENTIERTGPKGFRFALFTLRSFRLLHSIGGNWDVVHFHHFLPDSFIVGNRSSRFGKSTVFTNHSSAFLMAADDRRGLRTKRLLLRGVDGIIAPSRELAEKSRLIARRGQQIIYVPNGVDTDLFKPEEPGIHPQVFPPHRKVIIAVRRHEPKCGLEYLIKALPMIKKHHPEVWVALVGSGSETARLKALTNALKVEDSVGFLGPMANHRLPPLLAGAYASVLPSLYEAVSLAGLESLASGTPVVGSNVGGIPDIVKDGRTGLLVPPGDPVALATAVTRLLDDPALRENMATEARSMVKQQFTWEAAALRTRDFYASLLRRRKDDFQRPLSH